MLILVIAFVVSLIPSLGLYFWLKGLKGDDQEYRSAVKRALILGFLCVFPVLGFGIVFTIAGFLLGVSHWGALPAEAYHDFIVVVLSEELTKFLALRRLLKEHPDGRSWLDVIIFMSIIGAGFGLIEDIPYALSTNAIQMLVRGITAGHVSYGFIMGYFYGKSLKTDNRVWAVVGFAIPYICHALYDFCLSEPLDAFNENLGLLPVPLAFLDLVLFIVLILFVRKARTNPTYTDPLPGFESQPSELTL